MREDLICRDDGRRNTVGERLAVLRAKAATERGVARAPRSVSQTKRDNNEVGRAWHKKGGRETGVLT
jgi:hypothetical protein